MSNPTDTPAFNPWRIVTLAIHELSREGVKVSFTASDRLGGADELRGACELLRALGVEPVVPELLDESEGGQ